VYKARFSTLQAIIRPRWGAYLIIVTGKDLVITSAKNASGFLLSIALRVVELEFKVFDVEVWAVALSECHPVNVKKLVDHYYG